MGLQEESENLPKWSQFSTHCIAQGMQGCFGRVVDGTEDVRHHLEQSIWSLGYSSKAAVHLPQIRIQFAQLSPWLLAAAAGMFDTSVSRQKVHLEKLPGFLQVNLHCRNCIVWSPVQYQHIDEQKCQ